VGQINHLIGLILLVTGTGGSEESIEAGNLEGVALLSSSSSVLDEISIMWLINRCPEDTYTGLLPERQ